MVRFYLYIFIAVAHGFLGASYVQASLITAEFVDNDALSGAGTTLNPYLGQGIYAGIGFQFSIVVNSGTFRSSTPDGQTTSPTNFDPYNEGVTHLLSELHIAYASSGDVTVKIDFDSIIDVSSLATRILIDDVDSGMEIWKLLEVKNGINNVSYSDWNFDAISPGGVLGSAGTGSWDPNTGIVTTGSGRNLGLLAPTQDFDSLTFSYTGSSGAGALFGFSADNTDINTPSILYLLLFSPIFFRKNKAR